MFTFEDSFEDSYKQLVGQEVRMSVNLAPVRRLEDFSSSIFDSVFYQHAHAPSMTCTVPVMYFD